MKEAPRPAEVGTLVTDADLVIRGWDGWLARVTGIPADDARARPLTAVVPDLDRRGLLEVCRRVLATGSVELLAPAVHQALIPCPPMVPSALFSVMQQRVTIGPLRDGERVTGLIITIEDVTRRRERERALAHELTSPDPGVRARAMQAMAEDDALVMAEALRAGATDHDWRVRRAAVRGMVRRRQKALLVSVLTALKHDHHSFEAVSSALQVLALDRVEAVEPLIEFLGADDADLRVQAALALGVQHDARAVAPLMAALDDPDANVRFHAIEALGRLGATAAAAPLAAIAESRDFFLAFPALDALGRIGDAAVAPRIVPVLDDPLLGAAAAEALGQLGDGGVVPPLVDALAAGTVPAAAIVHALAALRDRLTDKEDPAVFGDLLRRSARPGVVATLLGDDTARDSDPRALAVVLGALADPGAAPRLGALLTIPEARREAGEALIALGAAAVPALMTGLDADDPDARRAAAHALGRIGDPRATAELVQRLADPDLAVSTADALGALADPRAVDALLGLLDHTVTATRQAAIRALETAPRSLVAQRIAARIDHPDARVREAAVRVAARRAYPDCRDALLRRCGDANDAVRRAALGGLARAADMAVVPLLVHALATDVPTVRAVAAQSLADVDGDAVVPALIAALHDRDPWVRYFATRTLGQRASFEALAPLIRLVETDAAPQVRIAGIDSLGRLRHAAALDVLARLANAANRDVTRAAIRAVATIGDAGARAVLRGALAAPSVGRRLDAIDAAVDPGYDGAVDDLRRVADEDGDDEVVRAAADALGRIASGFGPQSRDAADALIALTAGAETVGGAREAAAAALRQRPRVRASDGPPC